MRLTISGPPGAGKTTVCEMLGRRLGLEVVVSGLIFRQMAREACLSLADFGKSCELNPEVDKRLDQRIVDIARERDDVLIEGRLAGYMLQRNGIPAFKVFMDADLDVRAMRVAEREGGSMEERRQEIVAREECEALRYRSYYGIDISDRSIYDLIVNTTHLAPEKVVDMIATAAEAWNARNAGQG